MKKKQTGTIFRFPFQKKYVIILLTRGIQQMRKLKDLWRSFTGAERSWIAYDWANSVYATNIMAAIFPIYYATVAGDLGTKWFGIGVSAASLIVAVLAPVLGAIGDIRGYKKRLLTFF